jgi:hypothetical protein
MDFGLSLENTQKMKQPVNWWQAVAIIISLLIPIVTSWVTISSKISAQEVRIQRLENDQYNNQIKIERAFDKIEAKIDNLNANYTKILVELQNKANRN